jgi:hypothetical protein
MFKFPLSLEVMVTKIVIDNLNSQSCIQHSNDSMQFKKDRVSFPLSKNGLSRKTLLIANGAPKLVAHGKYAGQMPPESDPKAYEKADRTSGSDNTISDQMPNGMLSKQHGVQGRRERIPAVTARP